MTGGGAPSWDLSRVREVEVETRPLRRSHTLDISHTLPGTSI